MTTIVAWAALSLVLLLIGALLTLSALLRRFWRQVEPQVRPYVELMGGRLPK